MREGHEEVEDALKILQTEDGDDVNCVEDVEGQFYVVDDPETIFTSDDPLAIKLTKGRKQLCRRH